MPENPLDIISYKWNRAQALRDIPEGAQGSFAESLVVGVRYDDWTVQERLSNGIFNVGTIFVGGVFDQYRFLTQNGVTYLVSPDYKFMQRIQVDRNSLDRPISFNYANHHPF